MKVWQLKCCEEYFMQNDCGLFATKERALAELSNARLILDSGDDECLVITSNQEIITSRDPRYSIVTQDNMYEAIGNGYEFYNIIHQGSQELYGIYSVEVKE